MKVANSKPDYKPSHEKDISGADHLRSSKNQYAPPDRYLKFGNIKDKIKTPIDRRTTIFVRPGHDVEKAKAFYTELGLKYRQPEHRGGKGNEIELSE
jgi:hypothetical protein